VAAEARFLILKKHWGERKNQEQTPDWAPEKIPIASTCNFFFRF
jgi:hypothetical protein